MEIRKLPEGKHSFILVTDERERKLLTQFVEVAQGRKITGIMFDTYGNSGDVTWLGSMLQIIERSLKGQ